MGRRHSQSWSMDDDRPVASCWGFVVRLLAKSIRGCRNQGQLHWRARDDRGFVINFYFHSLILDQGSQIVCVFRLVWESAIRGHNLL